MVSSTSCTSPITSREYSEKVASSHPVNSTYADIARTVLFSEPRKRLQDHISSKLQMTSLQPADVTLKTSGLSLKTHRFILELFNSRFISKAEMLSDGRVQMELGLTVNQAKLFLDILHQKDEFTARLSATSLIHVLKEFTFYRMERPAIQCQTLLKSLFFQDPKTFPEALIACANLSSRLEGTAEIKEWALDQFLFLPFNYSLPQQDQDRLFSFFSKREDYFSCFVIAECHFRGWGTKKDLNRTLDMCISASKIPENDIENPMERSDLVRGRALTLQSIYLDQRVRGLTKNARLALEAKAFRCAKEAAALGHPLGITKLGICYQEGFGIEKDDEQAHLYLQQAAEMGSIFAMFELADMYIDSENESKVKKGIFYCEIAADMGFPDAHIKLAECYESGTGVEKNLTRAFQHYEKAAALGDDEAIRSLGLCYLEGKGVEMNEVKGLEILMKAAKAGNKSAALDLKRTYIAAVHEEEKSY